MCKKKLLSGLLSVLVLLSLLTVSVFAAEVDRAGELRSGCASYVNPLYPNASAPAIPDAGTGETKNVVVCSTVEEAVAILRDAMEKRIETVQFTYAKCESEEAVANLYEEILNAALAHTGVPTQGDYLQRQCGGWSGRWSYYFGDNGSVCDISFTFVISYYTTAAQEAEVDAAVKALLDELDLYEKTDYEKIRGIYDYICSNVVYDNAHLDDDAYKLQYTAYAALINGTSVCQGYANLFYRLALELGVDNRLDSGVAGGPHAWNIVKLDEKYYYLDSTWDAAYAAAGQKYAYFLRGSKNFCTDHTPQSDFSAQYPIDTEDYAGVKEVIASGTCGNSLTWALTEDYVLTISGNGEMVFDPWDTAPWQDYREQIVAVVIQNGVTTIGNYAFYECVNLAEVTIPDSVTIIDSYAFGGCIDLKKVVIPSGVTTVGGAAFKGCNALSDIKISDGVSVIGDSAFSECTALTTITLPESVTTVDQSAFQGCSALASIDLGKVETIGDSAFHYCAALNNVTIPQSVTAIGNFAFSECTSLTGITIPGTVTSMGGWVFAECTKLASVTISNGVTSIGEQAFRCCTALTTVRIPGSMTTVTEKLFLDCTALTSVILSKGVETIGEQAFEGCTGLVSVTIPASVTTVGYKAFDGCAAIVTVYFAGSEEQWGEITIKNNNDYLCSAELVLVTVLDVVMGDVNGDEQITTRDVIQILQAIASKTLGSFTDEQITASDVSYDDQINTRDAIMILQAIASRTTDQL